MYDAGVSASGTSVILTLVHLVGVQLKTIAFSMHLIVYVTLKPPSVSVFCDHKTLKA